MENTWPGGRRHTMEQDEHERRNSYNYPGTGQICCKCEESTTFCEEDGNSYCLECGKELGVVQ